MRSVPEAKRTERVPAPTDPSAPHGAKALTEALSAADLEVRAAAGLALADRRDPASVPTLAGIVADWDDPALAHSRRAALRTLISFRSQEAAVELARALARVPSSQLDLQGRSALLAVAYAEQTGVAVPRVVRALAALLVQDEQPVAERAAALLMLFPAESHRPLARVLRMAHAPAVRRRAAKALGACRQEAAVAVLVDALEDPAPSVRAAAASSLGDMRARATVVALEAARTDRDPGVREAAASSLRKLGAAASDTRLGACLGVLRERSAV
jgi:HEAT repeat protein